ncbi:RNA polymerase sigma factor [uncultured Litoreibacter sp.]|uniref:RNA polymerase sigma factor n=1 Tax=uncultured Litoreibacter sp. TaxID=1392394 RepID=UPI0026388BC4|nr:RNA polymerase sigma factor [uncultured Litoreibacter sp.]
MLPRLWRYCVTLTGNRDVAHDLTQTTCLRALEKSDQFEQGTYLDRWVFRIAQRIWLNDLRSQTVRRGGGLVPIDDADLHSADLPSETNIFVSQVLFQVRALPEAQRSAVMLVYVEGFSYREAADILEIPIGTVMSRLAAARKTLKIKLPCAESQTA